MEITNKHYVSTFYFFAPTPLQDLEKIKADLIQKADELDVKGLLILGAEGINTTCSCTVRENLLAFKEWISDYFKFYNVMFKDSESDVAPFRRYSVKIRGEIVTLKTPHLIPTQEKNNHLTPTQWRRVMLEEDPIVIDTRNWYEYKIGTFKGAVNPKIDVFTEFKEFMRVQNLPKDKKILIFCTGGIRCERGILDVQEQGYENVYHLEGGIIKYIEEYPNDLFEGECFVFDHRVALDQDLKPSKRYKLCPHCGQPADQLITCKRCDTEMKICEECAHIEVKQDTCSKHCANQFVMNPNRKGKRQIPSWQSNLQN